MTLKHKRMEVGDLNLTLIDTPGHASYLRKKAAGISQGTSCLLFSRASVSAREMKNREGEEDGRWEISLSLLLTLRDQLYSREGCGN